MLILAVVSIVVEDDEIEVGLASSASDVVVATDDEEETFFRLPISTENAFLFDEG